MIEEARINDDGESRTVLVIGSCQWVVHDQVCEYESLMLEGGRIWTDH